MSIVNKIFQFFFLVIFNQACPYLMKITAERCHKRLLKDIISTDDWAKSSLIKTTFQQP